MSNLFLLSRWDSHLTELSLHRLQGSFPMGYAGEAYILLSDLFGENPELAEVKSTPQNGRYNRRFRWDGVEYLFDDTTELCDRLHAGRHGIIIHGQTFERMTPASVCSLFRELAQLTFRATRIDVCYDDNSCRLLSNVIEAAEDGNFAGFQSHKIYFDDVNGDITGIAFGRRGRRGSGKYVRCYDKAVQSSDVIQSDRLELELSGDRADDLFVKLSNAPPGSWPGVMSRSIIESISFIDRTSRPREKNLCRIKPLPWWSAIQDELNDLTYRNYIK